VPIVIYDVSVGRPRFSWFIILLLELAAASAGCRRTPPAEIVVAPGVTFRRDAAAGFQVLDVDLRAAAVRPIIVADNVERQRSNFIGDCKTVSEWAEAHQALGGLNGGFFGDRYDPLGRRKQIVGLAAVDGKVIAPYDFVTSTRTASERFLRAAVGFTREGVPEITWATGSLRGMLRRYDSPVNPTEFDMWRVRSAVGCGPRLFANGARRVTDRDERRVSPGKLPRAFIAYDVEGKTPRHLILGRADAAEFSEVADYLRDYFSRVHQTAPEDAMCLDGGPSAQLVYRREGHLEDAEPTGVLVPTAILLVPRR
jgi:exopolysaccharide biosynthesis protein